MYTIIRFPFGESIRRDSDGTFIPSESNNMDYQAYLEWVNNGGVTSIQESVVNIPIFATKNTITSRMTDEELSNFDTWLNNGATVRQRRRWDDAQDIDLTDPELILCAQAIFGVDRAAIILAKV